jgi:hypothetical protein
LEDKDEIGLSSAALNPQSAIRIPQFPGFLLDLDPTPGDYSSLLTLSQLPSLLN